MLWLILKISWIYPNEKVYPFDSKKQFAKNFEKIMLYFTDANNRSIIKMAELHSSTDWDEILNRPPPVKVDSDEES